MEQVINLQVADNGRYRNQIDWIDFFNKERKIMISVSDVYKADFNSHRLITSTRIIYNPNDLQARIVHNFGSTIVKPTEKSLIVPVYGDEQVENVAKGEGLAYLQWLFNTEDNASKLIGRLEQISKQEAKDIRIWTPTQDSRKNNPERAVGVGYYDGRFHVDGVMWFDGSGGGHSCGVQSGAKISTEKEGTVQPTLEQILQVSKRFVLESSREEFESAIKTLYKQ